MGSSSRTIPLVPCNPSVPHPYFPFTHQVPFPSTSLSHPLWSCHGRPKEQQRRCQDDAPSRRGYEAQGSLVVDLPRRDKEFEQGERYVAFQEGSLPSGSTRWDPLVLWRCRNEGLTVGGLFISSSRRAYRACCLRKLPSFVRWKADVRARNPED